MARWMKWHLDRVAKGVGARPTFSKAPISKPPMQPECHNQTFAQNSCDAAI
jgi:hypothetical protein